MNVLNRLTDSFLIQSILHYADCGLLLYTDKLQRYQLRLDSNQSKFQAVKHLYKTQLTYEEDKHQCFFHNTILLFHTTKLAIITSKKDEFKVTYTHRQIR